MGLIKWIKRELDPSYSCSKRRQSAPPLSTGKSPDESYVKALSKFNEWRQRQTFTGSIRLTRKHSRRFFRRPPCSDDFLDNPNLSDCKELLPKQNTHQDSNSYEEILIDRTQYQPTNLTSIPIENPPIRHSFPANHLSRAKLNPNSSTRQPDNIQIYKNNIIDLANRLDQSPDLLNISKQPTSPPTKFFKENSNPYLNVLTPAHELNNERLSEELLYEEPRKLENLNNLRLAFKQFDDNPESTSSHGRSSRTPPYQTVINRHGEEVEYALPMSEKLSDQVNSVQPSANKEYITCITPTRNNRACFQVYVNGNFQFSNDIDSPGASSVTSFNSNHFRDRVNVPITDLDKTSETRENVDHSLCKKNDIIRELELLENWSQALSDNLTRVPTRQKNCNMNTLQHFVEIIVCNTNDIIESNPRDVLEICSGTLRRGTFYNVPVTRFKPHRREPLYDDSALQLNYEILSKIRHPNVALIMGIAVDNKCAVDSLILEPLSCSLHDFIHKQENILLLSTCLQFTLQINDAVTFLHINGLVHSNISSHSILMCHAFQIVKLTSFELTTGLNDEAKNEVVNATENDNTNSTTAINIPYRLRPYFVNYRKLFSKHNYQAPELLSRNPYVFPKEESDIYGICLTLWEMVNCSIPFADYDYDFMLKVAYLQNPRLIANQYDREKPFEKVLLDGLSMNPETRIANTTELKALLNMISLGTEDKVDLPNAAKSQSTEKNSESLSNLFNLKIMTTDTYVRSSPIKANDNESVDNYLLPVPQNIQSRERIRIAAPTHTSSPNTNSVLSGFDIGDVSLPETPIARSNKLRRNAWLSNQSISPIVHPDIQTNQETPTIEVKIPERKSSKESPSPKVYNVNIRIRPTTSKTQFPAINEITMQSNEENTSVTEPVRRKHSSLICDHINFFNSIMQSSPQNGVQDQGKSPSSTEYSNNLNKNTTKPLDRTEKILNSNSTLAVDQESINEFFNRSPNSADFENSLWRREKQKCDQGVKTQRRISVKDAVDKFESFSKLNDTHTPKLKKNTSITPTPTPNHVEKHIAPPVVSQASSYVCSPEKSVSKLNVVLQNKNNDKAQKVSIQKQNLETTTDSSDINQSPIVTLNFRKLDRRASDIGSNVFQRNARSRATTARHSIYGTQILQRLAKATNSSEDNANNFQAKNKDFRIKVGKLMCLNCGHRLFVVDDVVSSKKGEDVHEGCTEILFKPLSRNSKLQQVAKSTEDFYIDDDFREEECVNMELGTRSYLSELIDIDLISAQIFNPTEDVTLHAINN